MANKELAAPEIKPLLSLDEDLSSKSLKEQKEELKEEQELDSLEELLCQGDALNVITVKRPPYLTLRQLIEQIDEKPLIPISEMADPQTRQKLLTELDTFSGTLRRAGTFPLFYNKDDPERYLTLALRAHNESCKRDPNELIVGLEDDILPFLRIKLKDNSLERNKMEYILLSDHEFDDIFELFTHHEQRDSYLRKFSGISDAKDIFYAMMATAKEQNVSDIHIEPLDNAMGRIRFRIDGVLHDMYRIDIDKTKTLINFIKTKSNSMDISETRRPQDGAIIFGQTRQGDEEERVQGSNTSKKKEIEEIRRSIENSMQRDQLFAGYSLRIATMSTPYCENMSLRVEKAGREYRLDKCLAPTLCTQLRKKISEPHGIMIVTGPTGSGKTTTLYAILSELNTPDVNIVTIEDPIEQRLRGLNQSQVNDKIGWGFAQCLRAYMRHDPDIIFVGELRDKETAFAAVQSAQTGHLTFSTLHTNDAHSALERISTLGIDNFDIQSSLIGVLSQRLVRQVCQKCKESYDATGELSELFGKTIEGPVKLFKAVPYEKGHAFCKACNGYGYHGRSAIAEFWEVNDEQRKLMLQKVYDSATHYDLSIKNGMKPIIVAGLELALDGRTTLEELKVHLGGSDFSRKADYISKMLNLKFKD